MNERLQGNEKLTWQEVQKFVYILVSTFTVAERKFWSSAFDDLDIAMKHDV